MIGIVGPTDSVGLLLDVAKDTENSGIVVSRTYERYADASRAASDLDGACRVILFTGRVPFEISSRDHHLSAQLQYIEHGGIDLYHTLIRILATNRGSIPRFSLDTIDSSQAERAYSGLPLEPPKHFLPIDDLVKTPDGVTERLTQFHADLIRSEKVELGLTCLASVHDALLRLSLPTHRIAHTYLSLDAALRRAVLTDEVSRSESLQITIARIRIDAADGDPSAVIDKSIRHYARRLHGTLSIADESTIRIHTTRHHLSEALDRYREGLVSAFDSDQLPTNASLGFGVGTSASTADENARRAVQLFEGIGLPHVVFADGSVYIVDDAKKSEAFSFRSVSASQQALRRSTGLGPVSMRRLVDSLRRIDANAVTTSDLADAYGLRNRSARRILSQLHEAGIATVVGTHVGPGAG